MIPPLQSAVRRADADRRVEAIFERPTAACFGSDSAVLFGHASFTLTSRPRLGKIVFPGDDGDERLSDPTVTAVIRRLNEGSFFPSNVGAVRTADNADSGKL